MESTRPRWTVPVLAVLAASGLLAAAPMSAEAGAGAGGVYYVDSKGGDDSASGTSPAKAWRSLDNVNAVKLRPGDVVRLKRGSAWRGPLTLDAKGTAAKPISVEPYGKGSAPKISGTDDECVVIEGAYLRVSGLRASNCRWAGFQLGGTRNELDGVLADRNVSGVHVVGAHNVVRNSVLTRNDRMSVNDSGGDNDSGAFGVLLNGDDNLITGNVITGSYAASHDYGTDGAAVEVFNGDRNRVTRNIARDNETFVELGAEKGKTATGNLFAYNVVTSSRKRGSFLVTRGPGHVVGPVLGTVAVQNSVYLPARDTIGWSCHDGCSPGILRMRNNVVVVGGQMGFEDGKGADEGGSVYMGRSRRFKLGSKSVVADPRFRSRDDLRLRPGSPALDRGLKLDPEWYGGTAMAHDLAGNPLSGTPDAGAYQN
ncbi:hemolysin [Streptosporangium carneum]|uniref:Hemolysin n=2 Tax=Streptosporangium carneum TaxID=47481 RepID=A0A9W6HYM7_9ACTN|nr:hemolysin [Streptosporangium carneum]